MLSLHNVGALTISASTKNTAAVDVRYDSQQQKAPIVMNSITCESDSDPSLLTWSWGVDRVTRNCAGYVDMNYKLPGEYGRGELLLHNVQLRRSSPRRNNNNSD